MHDENWKLIIVWYIFLHHILLLCTIICMKNGIWFCCWLIQLFQLSQTRKDVVRKRFQRIVVEIQQFQLCQMRQTNGRPVTNTKLTILFKMIISFDWTTICYVTSLQMLIAPISSHKLIVAIHNYWQHFIFISKIVVCGVMAQ